MVTFAHAQSFDCGNLHVPSCRGCLHCSVGQRRSVWGQNSPPFPFDPPRSSIPRKLALVVARAR
eukprot:3987443-Pyramimonas_sp.AAC.1